jgi:hypothetical protein
MKLNFDKKKKQSVKPSGIAPSMAKIGEMIAKSGKI